MIKAFDGAMGEGTILPRTPSRLCIRHKGDRPYSYILFFFKIYTPITANAITAKSTIPR